MRFGILGPLEIRRDGRAVDVRGMKRRSVLARLLLDANSFVAADHLVHDLWEKQPPASAQSTLQGYVHQLRALLDPGMIVTRGSGYVLEVPPEALDSLRFEAAVNEVGKAELPPAAVAARLREALSLWRGPLLADVAHVAQGHAAAVRLEGLRLWALETLFDAELERERHRDIVPELEVLVAEHPLRERLASQLMLALYASGRQADALHICSRLRATLLDELGIQPSADITKLERMILEQDAALDRPRPPTRSREAVRPPSGIVSFLLTDVEGSTRSWDRAPRSMASALTRHDELIREIMDEHDGVLLKSRGEGDSTFSVFQRATDAVAAAFEVQQRFATEPWPEETPVQIRVAVHTGEAIERNDDYFGPAVNRAARLRAAAAGGQVLISGSTAELVRDHLPTEIVLEDLGSRVLKDLARPELVFEVRPAPVDTPAGGVPEPPHAVAFPQALARLVDRPFVNRGEELTFLLQAFDEARNGTAQAVLVAGEPGIGKTQLVAVAAQRLWDDDALVLYGHCNELALVPYQPFVDALEELFATAPREQRERWAEHAGPELLRLLPSQPAGPHTDAVPARDPEVERFLLFRAVVSLLDQCAQDRPVVLVLDDLHWADEPTLLLLEHIVTAAPQMRLLLVGTFRETDLFAADRVVDFLADMRGVPNVRRMRLAGLDKDAVEQLLHAVGVELGAAQLKRHADVLREETGGNPFFVGELVRNMTESGTMLDSNADPLGTRAELDVPQSVRDVVSRRVRRLGGQAPRVLTVAAVIGRAFNLALLSEVSGETEDALLEILELASEASIVTETLDRAGCFGFVHAIMQQTLYEEISTTRRRRIHRQVAEVMERRPDLGLGDRMAELAHHWFLADPTAPDPRALDYARRAGEHALERLAPQDARRWFEHGLRLLDRGTAPNEPDRERVKLEILLGDAQRQAGDPAYRDTLLSAAAHASDVGDDELLVHAALTNTRGWASAAGAVDLERVAVLEAAVTAVGPDDSPARARLLSTLAAELSYSGDWQRRLALSDEALAIARRVADLETLSYVLTRRPNTIWVPDTLGERLENTAENLSLAERVGDPVPLFWASMYRMVATLSAADIAEADDHLDRLRAIAGQLGLPVLRWEAALHSAWRALLGGHLWEAEELASLALEIGTSSGQPDAWAVYAGQIFLIRYDQGRLQELEGVVSRAVAENPGLPAFMGSLAMTYVEIGHDDYAAELLDLGYSDRFGSIPYDQTWLATMIEWSVVSARLQHGDAAALLYKRLTPWADQIAFTGAHVFGGVQLALALCAATSERLDDAERHFAAALATHERMGAPVWVARTELAWAEMLSRRGDSRSTARAVALAEHALRGASAVGAAGIEQRARELLSSA